MSDQPASRGSSRTGKQSQYFSVAELMTFSVEELQRLWDEIPPERQAFYEGAYGAALESLGPGDVSDDAAMGVIEQILSHYDSGQVPIVSEGRWVQVPGWVRDKVEKGEELGAAPEAAIEPKAAAGGAKPARKPRAAGQGPSLPMIAAGIGAAVVFICVAIMLIQRLAGPPSISEEDATGTAVAELAGQPTVTITPLSLGDADRIIRDGEDFKGYYPVILEVIPQEGGQRIFVVQQREIEIADWEYDENNPDVASWVSGLLVRPVLGIPYTEENAALINRLKPDDIIILHMSTGTALEFRVSNFTRINPQDTDIFKQVTPGIALVLVGDINSPDRIAVFGEYLPNQEVVGSDQTLNIGNDAAPAIPLGQAAPLDGFGTTVTVLKGYPSLGGNDLPLDLAFLFVDLKITGGEVRFDTATLQYSLTDSFGTRYSPVSFDTIYANNPPFNGAVVQPSVVQVGTVGFLVPRNISQTARFTIGVVPGGQNVAYTVNYVAPVTLEELPAQVNISSVNVKKSAGNPDRLVVKATITNPNSQALAVHQSDFYAIYSINDPGKNFPVGAQVFPVIVNGALQLQGNVPPNQSMVVEAEFNWDRSPYIAFYILGFQFIVQI